MPPRSSTPALPQLLVSAAVDRPPGLWFAMFKHGWSVRARLVSGHDSQSHTRQTPWPLVRHRRRTFHTPVDTYNPGGGDTTSRFKTPSVSGGLIASLREDPEAVLESGCISESVTVSAVTDHADSGSDTRDHLFFRRSI